jgi:hypothetical protein
MTPPKLTNCINSWQMDLYKLKKNEQWTVRIQLKFKTRSSVIEKQINKFEFDQMNGLPPLNRKKQLVCAVLEATKTSACASWRL